jgi:hypothetical protein
MTAVAPPVWLLDIDGVVNGTRTGWHAAPRSVTLFGDGTDFRIRYAPQLAGRIGALARAGLVEVRWCSTWCIVPDQLRRLEHLLGLPEFAPALPADMGFDVSDRKRDAARAVIAAGRRLIWTDDEEVPAGRNLAEDLLHDELTAGGRALLIRPESRRGLRPEHLNEIEAFARAGATEGVTRCSTP